MRIMVTPAAEATVDGAPYVAAGGSVSFASAQPALTSQAGRLAPWPS
jgi:hypothetical protein